MLVTTLPAALDRGAVLLVQTRALQLDLQGGQARGLRCAAVAINGEQLAGAGTHISARHVVVASGAINSPGLLLRSHAPDPHSRLGVRTFLHPVVASTAVFSEPVGAWHGAPRSMYSDHVLDIDPVDGPIGYKLEAPPLHPLIASTTLAGFGADQTRALQQLPYTQALLALLQDGFHPQSPGGRVKVGSDGLPVLDYPLNEFVFDGAGGRS